MNILHIFGNGFDLNLSLKTAYKDFLKYYLAQGSSNLNAVKELKVEINSDFENWSDLEAALGVYSKNLDSVSEVDEVIFDIVENLSSYLMQEETNFLASDINRDTFVEDLLHPERYLNQRELNKFNSWKHPIAQSAANSTQTVVHILTFNYTTTVEKILGENAKNLNLGKDEGREALIRSVEHIHGDLNGTPILGVNDTTQITNEKLSELRDVVEVFVKPEHNQSLGHLRDDYCDQQISSANIICIFGSSMGATDRRWWEAIGKRLGDSCSLIIFVRGNRNSLVRAVVENRDKREIIDKFLWKAGIEEEKWEILRKNIYVVINREIFNLLEST